MIAIATGACTAPASEVATPTKGGPLRIPGTKSAELSGWTCLQELPDNPPLLFHGLVRNTGGEPVTISKVSLVAAQQMELEGAYVARWRQEGGHNPPIGSRYPVGEPIVGTLVDDAKLPAGSTWVLVVGVQSTGPDNVLKRVRVDYRDASGNQYWGQTGNAFMIRSSCRGSEKEWPKDFEFPGQS